MIKRILYTENLKIGYKKTIISEINISVYTNDFIAILGKNGVGKTTFLNTLIGIIKSRGGSIFYKDLNINKLSIREKSKLISFVPARLEFMSNLKVSDLIELGRSPYTNIFDKKSENDKKIINKAILDFNLENVFNKNLYEISDGERQKAMICRAIVQQTPIILLDEPTAFLDYYNKQKLLSDLLNLSKQKNICIIISTHDIDIALKYCNKIWLFDKKINEYSIEEVKNTEILFDVLGFSNKA